MPGPIALNAVQAGLQIGDRILATGILDPNVQARNKLVAKEAQQLRNNNLGFSNAQRNELLRGSQANNAQQAAMAQARVAADQAAAGGPANGAYAAAQRGATSAAMGANAQAAAQVQQQSDQLAAQQRTEFKKDIDAQADRGAANWAKNEGVLQDTVSTVIGMPTSKMVKRPKVVDKFDPDDPDHQDMLLNAQSALAGGGK